MPWLPELNDEDQRAALASVERFCRDELAVICARPERPMTSAALAQLTETAVGLGLLSASNQAGLGLWEQPEDSAARALSLSMLRTLAAVNAGLAYHLHTLALACALARTLSLPSDTHSVALLQGAWGLGRSALPRFLRGLRLDQEETELLADYFGCAGPRELLLTAGEGWQSAILPVFDADTQSLTFASFSRTALAPERLPHAHGLDELGCHKFLRHPELRADHYATCPPAHARELLARALCLHSLALLAIGAGALEHAYRLARSYAGTRTQGGARIDRHAAVQELLGSARASQLAAVTGLEALAALPPGTSSLPRVFAARAELQPRLCAGANDALQVLGGLGYMRDAGLEKIVRDQNCLRLSHGSPPDLRRFIAEWERT